MDTHILDRLRQRAQKGKRVYGHGVRPADDTRQWGTLTNDWFEMAEEELLDAMMYVAADYHREYLKTEEVPITRSLTECELSGFHADIMDQLEHLIMVFQRRKR